MFCTACAAANSVTAASCASCGAGIPLERRASPGTTLPPTGNSPARGRRRSAARDDPSRSDDRTSKPDTAGDQPGASGSRRGVLHLLYTMPVLTLVAVVLTFAARDRAQEAELAGWYARAEAAAAAGDYAGALDAFAAATGYRDAEARRAAAAGALAPYRAAYLEGIAALDAGDFDAAIAALLPVASDLPRYEDVTARLADARRLRADDLRRQVEAAEARHDWLAAEQALSALALVDPGDPSVAPRLAALRRTRGPLVFGRDRGIWLAGPDGSDERLVMDEVPALWPVWSPRRDRIAFLSLDPDDATGNVLLYVVDVDGSNLTRLAEQLSAHAPPLWSPDGTRLAYTSFAGYDPIRDQGPISVRVVDLADQRETDLTGHAHELAFNPSWSPTGDRVAFVSKHRQIGERPQNAAGDIQVLHLASGRMTNLTAGRVPDAWSVAWSPIDDRLLVYSLFGQTWYEPPETGVRVLDVGTGDLVTVTSGRETVSAPVWSPDGSRFAYVEGGTVVRVRSAGRGEQWITVADDLSGDLAWAPDGSALIAAALDSTQPSALIPLDAGSGRQEPVALDYDADRPFIGPPQWSPLHLPPTAGPPTIAGTGLDR